MVVVVLHRSSGQKYVLLNIGLLPLTGDRSKLADMAEAAGTEGAGGLQMAAVAGADGTIRWYPAEELRVLEIDGRPLDFWVGAREIPMRDQTQRGPADPLPAARGEEVSETCPGCLAPVRLTQHVCPACGLTLIVEMSEEEDEAQRRKWAEGD